MNLNFHNVSFSYQKEEAALIRNFSLEAQVGDCIGIKGSSGSGKTTLIRLLLGFERPTKGQIYFNDKPLKSKTIKQLRNTTAWLPQDLDLGEGAVKDVFGYPFSFQANKGQKPDRKTVFSTFEKLNLDNGIWEERIANLSTGQRQRVGIAICHLLDKPILLLDEPTSALDESSKEKVAALLFENKQHLLLSTSHDEWWLKQCTKIITLNS